jgi:hypothetical protein
METWGKYYCEIRVFIYVKMDNFKIQIRKHKKNILKEKEIVLLDMR